MLEEGEKTKRGVTMPEQTKSCDPRVPLMPFAISSWTDNCALAGAKTHITQSRYANGSWARGKNTTVASWADKGDTGVDKEDKCK